MYRCLSFSNCLAIAQEIGSQRQLHLKVLSATFLEPVLWWWQTYLYLNPSCSNIGNIYVMHIRLPDKQLLTTFLVYQPFSQNKVSRVCQCHVLLLFFDLLFFMKCSCQLDFTVIVDIVQSYGQPCCLWSDSMFFFSIGFFQAFDYFPLQSSNLYLVAIGVLNQSFWMQRNPAYLHRVSYAPYTNFQSLV